ncbi:MAG: STAS domain-containing protein [Terracidiphilus sp.]
MNHLFYSATECGGGVKELVKGQEQQFLNQLQPLVVQQNVTLDLEATERIDAAGLAALIALYCDARKSGHRFLVANPSPRVSEILRMVGLDEILVSRNAEEPSCFRPHLQETAA